MAEFSAVQWVVLAGIALTGVIGAAHLLASLLGNAVQMHDLRADVAMLRLHQEAQNLAMSRDENPNLLPSDDAEFLRRYLLGEIDVRGRPAGAAGEGEEAIEVGSPDEPAGAADVDHASRLADAMEAAPEPAEAAGAGTAGSIGAGSGEGNGGDGQRAAA